MSGTRHIEVVTTDADQPLHARIVGGNGEPVWGSENYTRTSTASDAVYFLAEMFAEAAHKAGVEITALALFEQLDIRHADERETREVDE